MTPAPLPRRMADRHRIPGRRLYLVTELLVLFAGLPLLFFFELVPIPNIPALLVAFVPVLVVLLKDPSFDPRAFGIRNPDYLKKVVVRFVVLAPLIVLFLLVVDATRLFSMVRHDPLRWAFIVLIYPPLSAYPQEVLFRGFFFHRYAPLFASGQQLVLANVLAFAFLHVIYHNVLAVAFTLVGGYLFARTYAATHSLLVVTIEHTLYGVLLFTVGYGAYFL